MRKVLLVDPSQETLDDLTVRLSGHYDVRSCCFGPDALEEFLTFRPDLMVLDAAMPGCDTTGLLHAVTAQDTPTKVIATSCCFNNSIAGLLSKASFLLIKPFSPDLIITRLAELEHLLECGNEDAVFNRINAILQELGLGRNHLGFSCLAQAILYLRSKPNCLFTDDLYPHVAKTCGGSAHSVDKAMKRCIMNAWRKRNPVIWAHYFGKSNLCPTNVHFIRMLANFADPLPQSVTKRLQKVAPQGLNFSDF